jgi:hypothetical protein
MNILKTSAQALHKWLFKETYWQEAAGITDRVKS